MFRTRAIRKRQAVDGNSILRAYFVVAVIGFVVYALVARAVPYFSFDVRLTRFMQQFQQPLVRGPMWFISWMGFAPQAGIVAAVANVGLFMLNLRWEAIVGLIASAGTYLLNTGAKMLVDRPRPSAELVAQVFNELDDSCFPSGHVSSFTAIGGYFIFLMYRFLKPTPLRTALVGTLAALIGVMGLTRIYSGEHWPSDVLASYATGSIWLGLTIYVYEWGKRQFAHL